MAVKIECDRCGKQWVAPKEDTDSERISLTITVPETARHMGDGTYVTHDLCRPCGKALTQFMT